MKKVLFVATVTKHINTFHIPYLKWFKEQGYEVHVASKENENIEYCDKHFEIPFERFPLKKQNIKAYEQLKKIINENKYEIIHCHTPVGGVLTRLAARKARKKYNTKVIYTAHGFHFYKGAPLLNWIIYYPIEKICAKWTDCIITINKEDYELAKNKLKKATSVEYVHGVGVNTKKFLENISNEQKKKIEKELQIKEKDYILLYTAEISVRKNQLMLIDVVKELKQRNRNVILLLAGKDSMNGVCQAYAEKLDITDRIRFLGYRKDINILMKFANLAVSTSRQEGLPVNIMEALCSGLRVVATNCRGNGELINEKNGKLIPLNDVKQMANAIEQEIEKIIVKRENYLDMKYEISNVLKEYETIYKRYEEKKKIVIARSNFVEPDSRVEKEAISLVNNGYEVSLLAWNRSKNYFVKRDKKSITSALKISRISFGAKAGFGNGFKSLVPFIKFQLSLFGWLILNKDKYDICHFCDFDTAFLGSIACKIVRKKYIFDIFDYLSTNPNNFFQKVIEKMENMTINHAEATIICTEDRIQQIKKTKPKNLTIIHNSPSDIFDLSNIPYANTNKIRVVYVGILQDYRLLKEMAKVISEDSRIELHIGGFGKYESYMKDMSKRYDNIKYYGKLKYDETLKLEQSCDIMTAIYDPNIGNHIYAAPNKFYEALYLGKPLIMVKGTGMSNIVKEEKIGVLIDYNEDGFKRGLKELIDMREEWKNIEKRMKEIYKKRFSWSEMEKRLVHLYDKLL